MLGFIAQIEYLTIVIELKAKNMGAAELLGNRFCVGKMKDLTAFVLRIVWWVACKTEGRDTTVLKKDNIVGNSYLG